MNLNDLLLESSSVDYKEALEIKKPRSWLKSVSAFANSFGGHIVFGVRDNPREVCGLDNPQEVISKITELIKARIDPTPRYQLHAFSEDDKICIDLEIQNGPAYPYYYRFEGVCVAYIRNGDQSEETSRQQLSALILKGMNKTFDALPSPYHMGDVSFTLLAATFKNALKEDFQPDKDLLSTTLVTEDGQVTNGGLLLSPKTLRNYHMALHKCLQQAVKERLLVYNPCDAVTLPSGEKPEISVFTNDQQRALVQASYRHRYGVFIRLDLCTGLRMGELLALKWEDIDFSTAQLHVRRTINRLAKYEAHDGENKTEIVFGSPKTKNSHRTIPLTRTMADELARWKQQQAQDKIRAGDKYTDDGFIVTNEFGHYFEQKTFKDYYDRLLKDANIGHFTFHALRHTFATRALERGMDYKTLSAILGHYSVAFTMDTYVHSMDEHKRREMDKMDDMFGMQYSISVENQPYPVLCTLSPDGCTIHVPDFPKIEVQTPTLDAALLEVKQQIKKALRQYKNPPIPTKQDQIVVPNNSVLVLVKAS